MNKGDIEKIIKGGTLEEKRALFGFSKDDGVDLILLKFRLFSTNFPRYFKHTPADFHEDMLKRYIAAYIGHRSYLNIAYRGSAKTTLLKLFFTFALLNDREHSRMFLKVLTKDLKNSKQVVTDIYNLIIELEHLYGDVFEADSKKKREETMGSFTMKCGVKLLSGTVGQTQRGHVQDAYRPDFVWFDDIEDRDSADSDTITQNIINKVDEAIQGLSVDGNYVCTANYITDIGVIQNMRGKDVDVTITPIMDEDGITTWDYFTQEKITSIRLDAEDWFGEMMCDPVSGADREFKQAYFNKITMAEVMAKTTRVFLTIDSAVKKDEGADFSGFTLNFVCSEGKWHFKSWREKLNTGELIDKIFELWNYWKPKGLELVGLEETMAVVAIMPFLEEEMRKRNVYIKMAMLKHGGTKKETRVRGLIPRYTSHSIFHIDDECKDLEGELLRFPNSKNDDACFVGDTIIVTRRGLVRIDEVVAGDLVMTRGGYKEVLDSFCSGVKPIISKLGLVGTPNHPVITEKGEKELQYVDASDTLYTWNVVQQATEKLSYTEVKDITDIPTQKTDNIGCTSGSTTSESRCRYIGNFGLIIMEIYRRSTTFTTLMITRLITKLKTLRALVALIMARSTWSVPKGSGWQRRGLKKHRLRLQRGTKVQQAQSSTKNKQGGASITKSQSRESVASVGKLTLFLQRMLGNSARNVRTGSTQGRIEKNTPTTTQQRTREKERVYNLTVKDCPEFFANGILVHNCDSAAYQDQVAEKPYKSEKIDYIPQTGYDRFGINI